MSGFITKAECIACKDWIVSSYGADFYEKCLCAENTTFLALLVASGKI